MSPSKDKIETVLKKNGLPFVDVKTLSNPTSNTITQIIIKFKYEFEQAISPKGKAKSLYNH